MTQAVSGDAQLAAHVGDLLGRRHPVFAVAAVGPAGTRLAGRGADLDSDFEIGSISKGITGLLYADALARDEVAADTTIGDLLPLGDVPTANLTLASLSTHRSGLPSLPSAAQPWRRTVALWQHGTNPYGEDLNQLLEQARSVRVGRKRPRYSNLGFELLGHAIATAADSSFADLVATRLAYPLGLNNLYLPTVTAELRPSAVTGKSRSGRTREPWTGEAIGPAGGVRASIRDMARLVSALIGGSAPGLSALAPVAPFGRGSNIGAGWITTDLGEAAITWHNGGTGGFRSWLGLDRAAATGVVLLSATSASVDRHGFRLIAELPPSEGVPPAKLPDRRGSVDLRPLPGQWLGRTVV